MFVVCVPAATSDPTLSLAWSPNDHNKLFTGQAQKFLRVFDIRGEYHTSVQILLTSCEPDHVTNACLDAESGCHILTKFSSFCVLGKKCLVDSYSVRAFSFAPIKLWNSIPEDIRKWILRKIFKNFLQYLRNQSVIFLK